MHPVRGLRLVARGQERLEEDDEVRLRQRQPGSRGTRVQQKHLRRGIVPESSDGALPGTVVRTVGTAAVGTAINTAVNTAAPVVNPHALAPDALPPQNLLRVRQRVAKLREDHRLPGTPRRGERFTQVPHQRRHLGRLAHRRAVQVREEASAVHGQRRVAPVAVIRRVLAVRERESAELGGAGGGGESHHGAVNLYGVVPRWLLSGVVPLLAVPSPPPLLRTRSRFRPFPFLVFLLPVHVLLLGGGYEPDQFVNRERLSAQRTRRRARRASPVQRRGVIPRHHAPGARQVHAPRDARVHRGLHADAALRGFPRHHLVEQVEPALLDGGVIQRGPVRARLSRGAKRAEVREEAPDLVRQPVRVLRVRGDRVPERSRHGERRERPAGSRVCRRRRGHGEDERAAHGPAPARELVP